MAKGPSSAQRRAAVAKQLRDRKGRWIEMGAKVRFLVNGVERVGEVVGINGNDASVTYRGNNGKPMTAKINGKGLDVVDSKASLPGADEVAPKTPKAKVPSIEAPKAKRTKVEKLTAEDLDKLPSSSEVSSAKSSKTWRNYDGRWGLAGRGNPAKVSGERLASDYDDIAFDPEMPANKKLVDSDPELKSWLDSKLGGADSESKASFPNKGMREPAKGPNPALKKLGLSDEDIAKLEAAGSRKEAREIWAGSDFGKKADADFRRNDVKNGNARAVQDYKNAQAEINAMHPDEREDLELERLALDMRRKNIATPEEEFDGIDKRIAEIDSRMDELDKADGVDADATPDDATEAPKAELPEGGGVDDARRAELDKQIADLEDEEDFLKNSGATPAEIRAVKKEKDKLIAERDGAKKDAPAAAPEAPEAAPADSADQSDGDSIEIDEIDDLPDGSVVRLDDTINGDEDITEFHKDKGSWVGSNENEEVDLDTDAFKDYINSRDPKDIVHVKNRDDDSESDGGDADGGGADAGAGAGAGGDAEAGRDGDDDDLGRSMREEAERRSGERPASKKKDDDDKGLRKQAEKSVGERPNVPGDGNNDDNNDAGGPGAPELGDLLTSEDDIADVPSGTFLRDEKTGKTYQKSDITGLRDDNLDKADNAELAKNGARVVDGWDAPGVDDESDPEADFMRNEGSDDVDADGKVDLPAGSNLTDAHDFEAARVGTNVLDNKTEEVYTKDKDGNWKNADGESVSTEELAKNTATVMDDSDAKFQRENAAPRKGDDADAKKPAAPADEKPAGLPNQIDITADNFDRKYTKEELQTVQGFNSGWDGAGKPYALGDSELDREDLDRLPIGASVTREDGESFTKRDDGLFYNNATNQRARNADFEAGEFEEELALFTFDSGRVHGANESPFKDDKAAAPAMGQPEINAPVPGTRGKTGQALHTGDRVHGEDDLDKLLPGQTIADPNAPDQIWVKTDNGDFELIGDGKKLPADEIAREAGLSGRWEVVDANAPKDDDFDVDAINSDIPDDAPEGDAVDSDVDAPETDAEDVIGERVFTDALELDELPEGYEVIAPDGEGFVKNSRGRWVDVDSGENFSSERLMFEKVSLKSVGSEDADSDTDVDAGSADVPAVPDGVVGRDANGRAYVNGADGVALFEGDRVRSTKDGLEGEIVKVEANGKYVKVRGDDGKIRGRRINTIESADGGKKDTPESAPAGSTPAEAPEAPAAQAPAASGLKYDDEGRVYVESANGDPIFEGSTVVSNKDGLEGTVVKVEANGKYVKVKDADGKVRGRRATTLDVVVKVAADPGPKVFDPAKGPAQLDPEGASPDPDYEKVPVPSNLPDTPVPLDWTVDDVDSNPAGGKMSRDMPPAVFGPEKEIFPGVFQDGDSAREFIKAPDGSRLYSGQVVSFSDREYKIKEVGASGAAEPWIVLEDPDGNLFDVFLMGDELSSVFAPENVPVISEKKTAADFGISQEEYVSAMVQAKNYKIISRPDQGAMGDVTIVELPDGSRVVVKKVRGGSRNIRWGDPDQQTPAQEEVDAEYLSGKLMEALGIEGVQVSDAGMDGQGLGLLAVKVVPGKPASQVNAVSDVMFYFPDNVSGGPAEEYMESAQAKKIALLDTLISNSDRHKNNWFVDESTKMIYPIDHGFAWYFGVDPDSVDMSSPFADYYFGGSSLRAGRDSEGKPKFQYKSRSTATNGWTKSELLDFKSQYELLAPEFEKRGKDAVKWYTKSGTILDALIEGTPA